MQERINSLLDESSKNLKMFIRTGDEKYMKICNNSLDRMDEILITNGLYWSTHYSSQDRTRVKRGIVS